MLLSAIIESIYIYYVYNLFKTRYSFHHPIEVMLQKNPTSDYFKHPIYSGEYESKICPFGKFISKLLIIWIFLRIYLKKHYNNLINIKKINKIIFTLVLIGSILMNFNSFIYFIPVFIYELLITNK
jgi:hypothetical protein